MKKILLLILLIGLNYFAFTQELNKEKIEFNNGINLGFVEDATAVCIIYKHLFIRKHGLVIGLPILNITNNGSKTGCSISYRKHFKEGMNSGFWGGFFNYSRFEGKAWDARYTETAFSIGLNIGKRWTFNSPINLAVRIGYGVPIYNIKWITEPYDKEGADLVESIEKVMSGLDLEFSLGYCFK